MVLKRALAIAAVAAIATANVALGTHTSSGLTSTLLARGAWDRATLSEFRHELARLSPRATGDVAVVRATLAAGGSTDWHGHPGPSMVIVTAGQLRVLTPQANGRCDVTDYAAGASFFHTSDTHDFRNPGTGSTEFYVLYFVEGWPPLTHVAQPSAC